MCKCPNPIKRYTLPDGTCSKCGASIETELETLATRMQVAVALLTAAFTRFGALRQARW